ncbi:hypothetical protein CHCC14600_3143 [Bacillus licheniformis]|uniref:Uncharacterized protein n=1 Tax=Bacillus licheniformis TaxID=1402 RepID=A0A8B5YFF3_BACLI|nr:hypothetical protein CHCC20495_0954 [Bacillus licheniformis]TWK63907.1 hypothetical protein CHCC20342_1222 [Bacillus licheniformis]TWK74302.1 hypothetical protein CHCC20339_4638 [Bacillus licheniformis]TWL30695.1 hypothetical protein CHCC16736_1729 [Bacillus licheniformis]TWL88871.1 hypothetical protein CHCC15291_2603 [Bacillus licheniformis]
MNKKSAGRLPVLESKRKKDMANKLKASFRNAIFKGKKRRWNPRLSLYYCIRAP